MGIGIADTENYNYSIASDDFENSVSNLGTSKKADLKSYSGGAFKTANQTTITVLCEAKVAGTTPSAAPTLALDPATGRDTTKCANTTVASK